MTDTQKKPEWVVVANPVGANPGIKPAARTRTRKTAETDAGKKKDNVGGVIIYVALGARREEVARVGFIRETSENPKASFDAKLKEIVGVAQQTADTLNTLTPDGELL